LVKAFSYSLPLYYKIFCKKGDFFQKK
jgi:hypothetical protein